MPNIDGDLLRKTAPRVSGAKGQNQARIIDALSAALADTLKKYGIDRDLRIAHFVAQTCHESDSFCTTVEYSDGRYLEGRSDLGNTQPGDGPRYKGRGLIQLTGRANYKRYGDLLGLDLIAHPELAADPATSLVIACEYWKLKGLNAPADQDDIKTITRRINGGLNGLEDRSACLRRAKVALGAAESIGTTAGTKPTLRLGSRGEQVAELQAMLIAAGSGISADGEFGPSTAAAVKEFQTGHGLLADGVAGPATWNALGTTARTRPTLRLGSRGEQVAELQAMLVAAGSRISADGVFGPSTAAAVKEFQTSHGLLADGVAGPATWNALARAD